MTHDDFQCFVNSQRGPDGIPQQYVRPGLVVGCAGVGEVLNDEIAIDGLGHVK